LSLLDNNSANSEQNLVAVLSVSGSYADVLMSRIINAPAVVTGPGEVVVPFMGDSVPDGSLAEFLKSKYFIFVANAC
jgi:hypothetical protein